ncbi:MAG: GtrA family protein [Spirochaetes bacterium]|nr:GtrA family protein [Spirochaetota bacterium]
MIDLVKVRKALFVEKTENTVVQLFRYTFVGGLAFIVDFGTLFILTEYLNLYYLISAGIAFILGLITNYVLSINWVFSNRTMDSRSMEFFLFTVIGLIGLGLNELFLWMFTDLLSIYYLFSKIITAMVVYLWNFFARKYLLFNKK